MRGIVIDHVRARMADKRGGGQDALPYETLADLRQMPDREVVALGMRSKRSPGGPALCELVELKFFAGLTFAESLPCVRCPCARYSAIGKRRASSSSTRCPLKAGPAMSGSRRSTGPTVGAARSPADLAAAGARPRARRDRGQRPALERAPARVAGQRDAASRAGLSARRGRAAWLHAGARAPAPCSARGRLREPIGEGGMGSVWRARRSDGRFEGEAAIKVLKGGGFDAVAHDASVAKARSWRGSSTRDRAALRRRHHRTRAALPRAGARARRAHRPLLRRTACR